MVVIDGRCSVFFDCDDTLVLWNVDLPDVPKVAVPTVVSKMHLNEMEEVHEVPSYIEYLTPHVKHIEKLKELKGKGCTVVVWSQGGSDWAHAVVKALQLEEFVDLVIEKPIIYYDDLQSHQFMGMAKYIHYKDKD